MRIVPIELSDANRLVQKWHRHHFPVVGHRFSIGAVDAQGNMVGAAILGRPVARHINQSKILEITRLVTNGTKNACSFLYGASARIAKEMGYEKIQTYILDVEVGTSLKASGWTCETTMAGGLVWCDRNNKPRRKDQPTCYKQRWSKNLNTSFDFTLGTETENIQARLF